jgi:hypothetical protein
MPPCARPKIGVQLWTVRTGEQLRRSGKQLVLYNHDFEFTTTFEDGRTMCMRRSPTAPTHTS